MVFSINKLPLTFRLSGEEVIGVSLKSKFPLLPSLMYCWIFFWVAIRKFAERSSGERLGTKILFSNIGLLVN